MKDLEKFINCAKSVQAGQVGDEETSCLSLVSRAAAGDLGPGDAWALVADMDITGLFDMTRIQHQKLALMAFIHAKSAADPGKIVDPVKIFKHVDKFVEIPRLEVFHDALQIITGDPPRPNRTWLIWRVSYSAEIRKNTAFEDVEISQYLAGDAEGWTLCEKFDKLVQAFRSSESCAFSVDDYSGDECYSDIQTARLRKLTGLVYNREFLVEFSEFVGRIRTRDVAPFFGFTPSAGPQEVPDMTWPATGQ